jgi:hypothetical protein
MQMLRGWITRPSNHDILPPAPGTMDLTDEVMEGMLTRGANILHEVRFFLCYQWLSARYHQLTSIILKLIHIIHGIPRTLGMPGGEHPEVYPFGDVFNLARDTPELARRNPQNYVFYAISESRGALHLALEGVHIFWTDMLIL